MRLTLVRNEIGRSTIGVNRKVHRRKLVVSDDDPSYVVYWTHPRGRYHTHAR